MLKHTVSPLLFAVLVCLPAINYYLAQILLVFGIANPLANIFYLLIYASGLLAYFLRGNWLRRIVIVATVVILLLYSCLATDGVWSAISGPVFLQSQFMKLVGMYIPIVILISTSKVGFDIMMQALLPMVLIVNIMCSIGFVLQVINYGILQEYMAFAYTALPSILIGTYYGYIQKKRILFTASVITAVTIIFGGCRGALLTMLLFFALFLLFGIKNKITRVIIFLLCGVLLMNLGPLLNSGNSLLGSFGYESRIFTHVENATLSESESRNDVYVKAVSLINYYGHGVYSDRVLLQHIHDAVYCHNWVIEFLIDFGWILGIMAIAFVVLYLFKLMRHRPRGDIHYSFMVYFSLSMLLTKYMLSGSYLDSVEWALIIGWFINGYQKKRAYAIA